MRSIIRSASLFSLFIALFVFSTALPSIALESTFVKRGVLLMMGDDPRIPPDAPEEVWPRGHRIDALING
jgi:hypothetical protein